MRCPETTVSAVRPATRTLRPTTLNETVDASGTSAGPAIFTYDIDAIPDPNEHQLAALCRGEARRSIFSGFEHLLRVIAQFQESEIALALRFLFDPQGGGNRHGRLRLQLALRIGAGIRHEITRQLIEVGPIGEFFKFRAASSQSAPANNGRLATPAVFPFACDILRRESWVETQLPRELNRYVPTSGVYYSPVPLGAREDNDYLALDTILSKLEEPCAVELLVTPVDHTADLQAHDKYLRQLRAINEYGDDVYLGTPQESRLNGILGDDNLSGAAHLRETRKRDPAADEILHEQQEFHRLLRQPQLLFNAKVFATRSETALMIASVVAECGLTEGKYQLVSYDAVGGTENAALLEASWNDTRNMKVSLWPRYQGVWGRTLPETWNAFHRLSRLASVDELKGLFRLPIGGSRSPRCLRQSTDPENRGRDAANSVVIGDDLESETPPPREYQCADLATTFDRQSTRALELRLPLNLFTKHLFVAGVPGSGKTTAVFNLLIQLARHGIPFLVIEPAKTEYRMLKMLKDHPDPAIQRLARDVRVFTPGNEDVSPLRFNPLEYPPGVTLDEHIGQLLACFEAAMPMGGPLQALIAEALEAVYANGANDRVPQMTDLVEAARAIMSAKSYEGETRSNLQAAIEVRLGLLTRRAIGRLFRTTSSIPNLAQLLAEPTVIELDYLPQDQACLLTLFLLAAMREQIRISPDRRRPGLHHVTVIEEAHNIVGRTGAARASEEVADPKAFAAEYVSRMLAELRALGEGIIIADQLPSTVSPQVVKNTGTKLAHRLVSADDREDLGGAMLMGPSEMQELARLGPGTGYLYTEGLYRPRRVRCLNSAEYLRLQDQTVPVGPAIVAELEADAWFIAAREERALSLLAHLEDCQRDVIECVERAAGNLQTPGYEQRLDRMAACPDAERGAQAINGLIDELTAEFNKIEEAFETGYQKINKLEVPAIDEAARSSEQVKQGYEAFVQRHEREVAPRYEEVMKALLDIRRRAGGLQIAPTKEN